MKIILSDKASIEIADAPPAVRKAFHKQLLFLERGLRHPSLRAKKYDEVKDRWQARVNRNWRFYFKIVDEAYIIEEIVPLPK